MDEMLRGISPSHMFSHINHNHISYLNQIYSLGFSIRVWSFLPPSTILYGIVDGADTIHPALIHKPALFENNLSNIKGQLSAWKLAEVADLSSIVENLYRQGGKMMFADPLSRVCGPTEGWYDPSLPRKLAALFEHLPTEELCRAYTNICNKRNR
jgi:hypothetical protein